MIFHRSVPPRRYRDYTRYRTLLRRDFQYRCAYCLTHERYLGGEAGCAIDHHRPRQGSHARPDLASAYANLYWACRECNDNKSDTWPDPECHRRTAMSHLRLMLDLQATVRSTEIVQPHRKPTHHG